MVTSILVSLLLVASTLETVMGASQHLIEQAGSGQNQEHMKANKKDNEALKDYYRSMLANLRERNPTMLEALGKQQRQQQQPSSQQSMRDTGSPIETMLMSSGPLFQVEPSRAPILADNGELERRFRLSELAKLLKSTSGHLLAPMLYAQALNQQQQQQQPMYRSDRGDGEMENFQGSWPDPDNLVSMPSAMENNNSNNNNDPRYNMYRLFGGADKKRDTVAGVEEKTKRAPMVASKRGHHASASAHNGHDNDEVEDHQGGQAWTRYLLKSRTPANGDQETANELVRYFNGEEEATDASSNDVNVAIIQAIKTMYENEPLEDGGDQQQLKKSKSTTSETNMADKMKNSDYVQRIINDKWNILKHLNFGNNNNKIESLRQQEEKFKRSADNNKLIFRRHGIRQQQQPPSPSHMDIAQALVM